MFCDKKKINYLTWRSRAKLPQYFPVLLNIKYESSKPKKSIIWSCGQKSESQWPHSHSIMSVMHKSTKYVGAGYHNKKFYTRQHFETSIYTYYIYAVNSVLVYKNNIIIV